MPSERAWSNPEDKKDTITLWDAVGDLPPLSAGSGSDDREYDLDRRSTFVETRGARAAHYLQHVAEVDLATSLTAHVARPHNEQDLRDFDRLREGEHSAEALARGEAMEFTYNRKIFKDRYKRQHRNELCSTIVAHLSKDGLMFIHPTQLRSLTPREAARVQSFPDWFKFPVARTHQYRIIGNAVPPLVSEAVGHEIKQFFNTAMNQETHSLFSLSPLPENEAQAIDWLLPLLDKSQRSLRQLSADEFKRAWYSIAFVYAGLHPDSALDHGTEKSHKADAYPLADRIDKRLSAPYYERSGWPVVLAPIVHEAWRRYAQGTLKDEEFYCSEAQMAGMCHRSPELAKQVAKARRELEAA